VTVAEAEREAEILRGQGDAERSRVFADAYTKDPSFFEFYRSMRAYETSLNGTGTTLVLSPDSEFLRFFQDASGGPAGTAAAPPAASSSGTETGAPPQAPAAPATAPAEPAPPASAAPAPAPAAPAPAQ
jgi:membrane protease subunit HflC